jgi:UDP-N-acetylmuramate dehydrogenase
MEIFEDISLKPFNTFGIQAQAQLLINITSLKELMFYLKTEWLQHKRKMILGGGSNVLFTRDYHGLIIRPIIKGIEIISEDDSEVVVRAMCGENWDDFVGYCVERGWGGLENLSLIPGNMGACPIQNIGAYGVEVKDVIESLETIDLMTFELVTFNKNDCEFGYRTSIFKTKLKDKFLIYAVTFRLSKKPVLKVDYRDLKIELENHSLIDIVAIRQAVSVIRNRKLPDPSIIGNAGSFFKNPTISQEHYYSLQNKYPDLPCYPYNEKEVKIPAAWLIEKVDYKGIREREVGTSAVHPLVIVNYGDATGDEVLAFAQQIQNAVSDTFQIELEMEVNVI